MQPEVAASEFHALGLGDPLTISAAHGENVSDLIDFALADFPEEEHSAEDEGKHPRIAIVGRPNVGKSTLVNALIGEERVIVFDQPGTTRDSIYIDFEWDGRPYTLIDTAGVRKRGRIDETAEKFSVVKTMQAIADANVVVLVLDATQEISEQDAHIAGFILEAGRALVLAVNKWEAVDEHEREQIKRTLDRKLKFLSFARLHFISALRGHGIGGLMKSIDGAYAAAMAKLPTPKLTRALTGCNLAAAAAACRLRQAQAALCPPGRLQPAAHHHPRHGTGTRSRQLPPLFGTILSRGFQIAGNAAESGAENRPQSLRPEPTELRFAANPMALRYKIR